MALSGTINGTTGTNRISSMIVWSATQPNKAENYSEVTATLYYSRTNTGYTTKGTWNGSITINGTTTTGSKYIQITYNSNTIAMSATTRVYHDPNGSKAITISASGSISDTTLTSTTCGQTVYLDTIPRQATLTAAPDFTDAQNPTITYSNPAGTAVTSLQACISLDGSTDNIAYRNISTTGTSYTFTLTAAEKQVLYNATPKNSRQVMFFVRTVIGGSTYLSSTTKNFTIVNANPTFAATSVTYADSNTTVTDFTDDPTCIVRNQSNLKVTYVAATANKGATMSKYEFTLNGVTKTSTAAGGTIDFGKIDSAEDLTLTAKATDSRGNYTVVTKTVNCVDYASPSVTSFTAYRANSSGSPDLNGSYIQCNCTLKYYPVDGCNVDITAYVYSNPSSPNMLASSRATTTTRSFLIDLKGDTDSTHKIYVDVWDNWHTGRSSIITIFGGAKVLNITPGGTGIALGKKAEIPSGQEGIFESRWPAQLSSGVTVGTSSTTACPTSGIKIHDVRDAVVKPTSFGNHNANLFFDADGNGQWYSGLHMHGWNESYAAWELIGNAHNTSVANALKYRQGIGDTWDAWQTILTNSNASSFAIPTIEQWTTTLANAASSTRTCAGTPKLVIVTLVFDSYSSNITTGVWTPATSGKTDMMYCRYMNGSTPTTDNWNTTVTISGKNVTVTRGGNASVTHHVTAFCL